MAFIAGGLLVNLIAARLKYLEAGKLLERLYLPWNGLWIVFYATFVTILVAYLVWLLLLLHGGLSVGSLMAALKGTSGASFDVRDQGQTLPGVTTLVQLEMGFMIIGLILAYRFGCRRHFFHILVPLLVVVAIAWVRSKLWSERLAVIELLVPGVLLIIRLSSSEKWKVWQRAIMAAAPLAGPPLLFIFFSVSEYSRSWSGFYSETQSSFLLFSFMRLTGYYVTALNNGAASVEALHHYDVPYNTLEWFWKFPLVKSLMPYESMANSRPSDDYEELLTRMANPEFNNPSGVFVVRLDYGYTGGLFVWFIVGIITMVLYRSFVRGSLSGLLLYPFLFVGLLESPRVFYWGLSRGFPTWALLFFVLLLPLFTSGVIRRRTRMRDGLVTRAAPPSGASVPTMSGG